MRFCFKITMGTVFQKFDTNTGKCLKQYFVCGDEYFCEDENGNRVDEPKSIEYQPYHMSVRRPESRSTLYQMISDLHLRLFGGKNVWEYTAVENWDQGLDDIDGLNKLGQLGWELVDIERMDTTTWWYLKRRIRT